MLFLKNFSWTAAVVVLLALGLAVPASAQLCSSATSGVTLGFVAAPDQPEEDPANCLGIWWCYAAEFLGTSYESRPLGCDPTQGPCGVRARVDVGAALLEPQKSVIFQQDSFRRAG